MTDHAVWLQIEDRWCDEHNDGYAWSDHGEFVACFIATMGGSVPLWESRPSRTEVTPDDVTAVIAEQCDVHQTGLLMIDTGDRAGLLLITMYAILSERYEKDAASMADALGVPLITREGCS